MTLAYAKAYRVFNADQIEGLPVKFYILPDPPRDLGTVADPALEALFAASGAQIDSTEEPRAYYNIKTDRIHMPPIATFHRAAGYDGTLAHELTHNADIRVMPHGAKFSIGGKVERLTWRHESSNLSKAGIRARRSEINETAHSVNLESSLRAQVA